MMALQTLGPRKASTRRRRPKRLQGIAGGSSRIAAGLLADLRKMLGPMVAEMAQLAPWLASNPGAVVALGALNQQLEKWRRVLGPSIKGIAAKWVAMTDERDRRKLEASLAKALGVPAAAIFDEQPVKDVVELMGVEATHLITTIPEVYHSKVQEAVMQSYQQIALPDGQDLISYISSLEDMTYERAKTIAVDQTNKMHSMVTQARQSALGIEEYIWRTAKDQRVVGNPSGLYPVGNPKHGNHFEREGKVFRWDEPPADGHPGWAIRCRCHAEPIIDYDKLRLN